jgi:hypothetical protein
MKPDNPNIARQIIQYDSIGVATGNTIGILAETAYYAQNLAVTSTNKLYVALSSSCGIGFIKNVAVYNSVTPFSLITTIVPPIPCASLLAIGNSNELYIANSSFGVNIGATTNTVVAIYDTSTDLYSRSVILSVDPPLQTADCFEAPSGFVRGLGVDSQDNIYLTVGRDLSSFDPYACNGIVKFSSAGAVLWYRRFQPPTTSPYNLNVIMPGGGIFIDPAQSTVVFSGATETSITPELDGMVLNQAGGIISTVRPPGYTTGSAPSNYIPMMAAPGSLPSQKNLSVIYVSHLAASTRDILILSVGSGTCHPTTSPTKSPTKNPV